MTFEDWWKQIKAAECDEVKDEFEDCWREAMNHSMDEISDLRHQNDELKKNDCFPQAHRLALELECLLLSTRDTAAVSKWWDSAHEALEQWREFCSEIAKEKSA